MDSEKLSEEDFWITSGRMGGKTNLGYLLVQHRLDNPDMPWDEFYDKFICCTTTWSID